MARAQDAPLQQGGQINPYVASSAQQGKQQAENRLLSAVRESGETQRAKMRETGANQRTAAQIQAQKQMQAAELEAQDRRAAEAEQARREDREFAMTMQEATQAFQSDQSRIQREYEDAVRNKEWDRADEIIEQAEAARRFDYELELDDRQRTANALLSMKKMGFKREAAKEKAITTLVQQEEQFARDKEMYDTLVENTTESFNLDKRMDLPVSREKPGFGAHIGALVETMKHPLRGGSIGEELGGKVAAAKEATANPLAVLQDQLSKAGTDISVEELHPERINMLENRIAEGQITAQEIRNTMGVLNGALPAIDKKLESAEGDTEEEFWRDTKSRIINMRNSIESLRRSDRKLLGEKIGGESGNETVGVRVRSALSLDTSLGGMVSTLKKTMGTTDWDSVLDEMTKPLLVPSLKPITPDMTTYEKRLRQQYNAIILRKYPELGDSQ